jgi:hypothetical protein
MVYRKCLALIAASAALIVSDAALAAPPTKEDIQKLQGHLTTAVVSLHAPANDPNGARQQCTEAQNILRRFDQSNFWTAEIEMCFAQVDDFQKRPAACDHYVSAADNYAKARNDPQSRHIESSLLIIGRSHARLKCKGAIAGPQLGATGRDPTAKDINELMGITLRIDVAADLDHNAQNSAQICMDAIAIAGRFNPTNYVTALLEECLAKLEQARKHTAEACGHYAKVTENYSAMTSTQLGYKNAAYGLEQASKARQKLGCK